MVEMGQNWPAEFRHSPPPPPTISIRPAQASVLALSCNRWLGLQLSLFRLLCPVRILSCTAC